MINKEEIEKEKEESKNNKDGVKSTT